MRRSKNGNKGEAMMSDIKEEIDDTLEYAAEYLNTIRYAMFELIDEWDNGEMPKTTLHKVHLHNLKCHHKLLGLKIEKLADFNAKLIEEKKNA